MAALITSTSSSLSSGAGAGAGTTGTGAAGATAAAVAVVSSVEIEELNQLKPFVTDIRPESSSGVTSQPGMFATVYLKTEPQAKEAESWTVMIDDLGEMIVEKATN